MHPYADEMLIFVGLDANRPEYLGAEVEVDKGMEYEEHLFRAPTIICIPRTTCHIPVVTTKCEKPFAFIACYLGREYVEKDMPAISELDVTEGDKYSHLYKKMVFQEDIKAKTGPGNADALAWYKSKDLENFDDNFAFGYYSATGDWGVQPHTHVGDQVLAFVGLDAERPDHLGAEIEISLGAEQEKHIISAPSMVVCKGGFLHGPIVTKAVDRPFGFYTVRHDKGDSEINPA